MSCIVTPMPPAPHAPCMRALATSYDTPFHLAWQVRQARTVQELLP